MSGNLNIHSSQNTNNSSNYPYLPVNFSSFNAPLNCPAFSTPVPQFSQDNRVDPISEAYISRDLLEISREMDNLEWNVGLESVQTTQSKINNLAARCEKLTRMQSHPLFGINASHLIKKLQFFQNKWMHPYRNHLNTGESSRYSTLNLGSGQSALEQRPREPEQILIEKRASSKQADTISLTESEASECEFSLNIETSVTQKVPTSIDVDGFTNRNYLNVNSGYEGVAASQRTLEKRPREQEQNQIEEQGLSKRAKVVNLPELDSMTQFLNLFGYSQSEVSINNEAGVAQKVATTIDVDGLTNRVNNIPSISVSKTDAENQIAHFPTKNAETILIASDSKIVDQETGKVIAYFLKNVLPAEKVELWTKKFKSIPQQNSVVGDAGGQLNETRINAHIMDRVKQGKTRVLSESRVKDNTFRKGNTLYSTVLGFKTQKEEDYGKYNNEVLSRFLLFKETIEPFFDELSEYYRIIAPEWHEEQEKIVNRCNRRMGNSVFTNATFNRSQPNNSLQKTNDSQTACHRDRSHAESGHEFFAVLGKDFEGGELLFPEYNVALQLAVGDIVAFSGKTTIHGNTPLTKGLKLSVISYVHKVYEGLNRLADLKIAKGVHLDIAAKVQQSLIDGKCPIDGCKTKAPLQSNYMTHHIKHVHGICLDCKLQFPSKWDFENHNFTEHSAQINKKKLWVY